MMLDWNAYHAQILETLGVAVAVNVGAALVYSTRVLDAAEVKERAGA